jgi:hypothetical protein
VEHLAIERTRKERGFRNKEIAKESTLKLMGYSFIATEEGIFDSSKQRKSKQLSKWTSQQLQNNVHQLLKEKVIPYCTNGEIIMMTTLHLNGNFYRADPSYKGKEWNDWAYCDWGTEYGLCPVQLQIFADLSNLSRELTINGVVVYPGQQCAIVHMIEDPIAINQGNIRNAGDRQFSHPSTRLFCTSQKMRSESNDPVLAIIDVQSIFGPCIAISYSVAEDNNGGEYLFLESRENWSSILLQCMKDGINRQKIV